MDAVARLVARLLQALRAHDAAGCAALFTDDARLISPYAAEATGRAAIEALHRSWFAEGETDKRLYLLDLAIDGDTGYCLLAFAADYPQPDGSRVTERGKSLNVLKRQPDGGWLIHVSSLNSDQPA